MLAAIDPAVGGAARELALLLRAAGDVLARAGSVEDALWLLWSGTEAAPSRWPGRLRRAVDRGGAAGRLADRDLDAVLTLFALAARAQASGFDPEQAVRDAVRELERRVRELERS